MFKNYKEIKEYIKKEKILFIDFKIIDLCGRLRHLTIPASRFTETLMKDGIGFDASNYGYAQVEKSDMVFYPDLASAHFEQFSDLPTLSMFGDVYVIGEKNVPFNQYPRNIIKAAVDYMKSNKIADEMIIGPEYEFSVFDSVSYSTNPKDISLKINNDESIDAANNLDSDGYHSSGAGAYHIDQPVDKTFDFRNEACLLMNEYDIPVKYHHHEVGGSGQLEIEVEMGDVIKMADDTIMAKYIIKNVAREFDMSATFMPKPIFNEAGNGMHVHMLLRKNGKSVFYEKGKYSNLSTTAMYFMGGILKHIKSLCAICNPTTNSYKRLVPGFEAPTTIGYATANRSSVIRIPSYAKKENTRFELRNPDATCNPYLAYSAILMAGIDGIKNKIDPQDNNWGPYDCNLFDLSDKQKAKLDFLPGSLDEAIDALKKDYKYLLAGDVFSEDLINRWIKVIEKDNDEIKKIPHPAEYERYFDL
ncbi:MAG: type I glutamate--ammonia ligase [Erysipelotrichaceae bacterium]|nr:type I glutamate--ammonia ligase [Erysipelotrichaceae bacterium]